MSYFLCSIIIIAIISVLYVWYVTRWSNSISDDQPLYLNSEDDKLLIHWYNANINPNLNFDIDDQQTATRYLKQLYNIDIDPNLIVTGTNLTSQYDSLTTGSLSTTYNPSSDCIFDLRSTI